MSTIRANFGLSLWRILYVETWNVLSVPPIGWVQTYSCRFNDPKGLLNDEQPNKTINIPLFSQTCNKREDITISLIQKQKGESVCHHPGMHNVFDRTDGGTQYGLFLIVLLIYYFKLNETAWKLSDSTFICL